MFKHILVAVVAIYFMGALVRTQEEEQDEDAGEPRILPIWIPLPGIVRPTTNTTTGGAACVAAVCSNTTAGAMPCGVATCATGTCQCPVSMTGACACR